MPSHRNTLPAQPRNAARNTGLASPRATPLARALAAIGVGVGVGALSVAPTYAAVVPGCAVADVYTILGNTAANNTRVLSANVYDNDSSASSCPVSGAIGTVTYGLRPNPSAATPTQGVLTWTGVPFDGGYASGAFTYKPNIGATGSDSFGYCLYDSENGVSDCANVSVSITAPTNCSAQFDNFTVNGNSTITASSGANVLTNDSTNPNVVATLSVTSFTAAANGVANVSSTGVFTYAPTGGFSGNDRVSYAIDASCAGATNTIAFVRVLPIAIDDNFSTQINTPLTSANLLLNDFVRPVRITCPSTSANGGLVSNCSTSGAFRYTPPTGFTGADSFSYSVYDDAEGVPATANVFINVVANQPPVANSDGPYTLAFGASYSGPASGATNILANDTDPESDTLTVIGNTAPGRGSVGNVASTGAFTYAPNSGISGTDSFTYTVSDGNNNNATATVAFLIRPAAVGDTYTTPFNTQLVVPLVSGVLSNDGGSGLTVLTNTTPAHGSVNVAANGSFTYTPLSTYSGADSFTYTLKDQANSNATATVNLTVGAKPNTPPVANADGPIAVAFGGTGTGNVLTNDSDADGDTLTVTGNAAPSRGSVGNVSTSGAFTYTPNVGISGVDSFSYSISDGKGGTASNVVSLIVAPRAVADTYTTPFNTPLIVPLITGVLSNDGGSGLTILSNTTPARGSVNVAANGTFTYTPLSTYSGADSFTYTLKDQANSNATATVNLTVGAKPNAPPVANADGPIAVAFGGTGSGNVLTNDSDADGDTLTVTGNAAPSRGSVGNVSTSGAFTYTPNVGISGVDSFSYTISDGKGGTASNVVSLIVAPRAVADTYSTPFNTPLIVPLVTGVLSNDGGSGLTVLSNTNPARGSVNVAANGTFTYTPLSTYSGADSFTYTLKDQANSNATATVNLTVGAKPNTPPVANADGPIAVAFGGTGTGNVLTNDSDADGDTLTVTGNAAPSRGSVGNVSTSGAFTYTPNVGISGADSFSYTISDGKGGTAGNVVSFIVAPKAVTDNYATPFNTPLIVPLVSSVLSNDGGTGLTILSNTNPAHGSVNVAANGTFTYTPVSTYSGADSFTYTLKDQANSNATATVNLSVGVAPISFGFVDASGSLTDTPSLGRGAVQRTIVSTAFAQPLTVKVLRSGAPVVGQLMCFSVTPAANGASATLSSATAATDANGVASVTARANTIAGSYTVVVTVCPVAASADRATLKASVSDSLVISLANDPLAIEPSVPVPSVLGWLSGLLSGLLALIGVAFTGRRRR